jgi:hypothetical protein
MAEMQVDTNLVVISTIGGTGAARVKYDGDGLRVHIHRRFVGQPWTKLNLIQENNAQTAQEAAEAEVTGGFTTPALSAGQVLQYGLLLEESLDPNAPGFSLGRFSPLVTIVAVLAGESQPGWIVDQNLGAGGTFYRRQVATGARVTTMMMEIGEDRPTRDATGIWRIPSPAQTLVSTAATNHVVEALNLLPGHHHFATVLLVDAAGQWSSLAEEFTTLRRRVTVNFKHLEVLNDGDTHGTSHGQLRLIVRQRDQNAREFLYDHTNLSDKIAERQVTLEPFGFVHVIGPEVVDRANRDVGVWVLGTEFDGGGIFEIFDPDEHAASKMITFALPTGLGKEQVLNAPVIAHARPSPDGGDFEFKVTVLHSIEYVA